jgi:two-component system, LytTR family, response regulator
MNREKLRAIIVEDEENSRENLKNLLQNNDLPVEILGEADSIKEAMQLITKHRDSIDLAFLDVQIADGTIFTLLDFIEEIKFDIIFISAYKDTAHMGYKYSAIDFLPKPIDEENLKSAVERSYNRKQNKTKERLDVFKDAMNNPNPDRITITSMDSFDFVNLKDIVRLEGFNNYTVLYLTNGDKVTASKNIKVFEDMLPQKNFFRVHKSHIINTEYLRKFIKGEAGTVQMADGKSIDVSRRRRPLLIDFLRKQNPSVL